MNMTIQEVKSIEEQIWKLEMKLNLKIILVTKDNGLLAQTLDMVRGNRCGLMVHSMKDGLETTKLMDMAD